MVVDGDGVEVDEDAAASCSGGGEDGGVGVVPISGDVCGLLMIVG